MFTQQYDCERHDVQDTAYARFLRRELNDPKLFTYRSRRNGQWAAAGWLDKEWGEFMELACLGPEPVGRPSTLETLKTLIPGNPIGEENRKENRLARRFLEKHYEDERDEERKMVRELTNWLASWARGKRPRIVAP